MEELPTDSLVNGAEGIKDMIRNFEEAYVEVTFQVIKGILILSHSRKQDIENERLPPELYGLAARMGGEFEPPLSVRGDTIPRAS